MTRGTETVLSPAVPPVNRAVPRRDLASYHTLFCCFAPRVGSSRAEVAAVGALSGDVVHETRRRWRPSEHLYT